MRKSGFGLGNTRDLIGLGFELVFLCAGKDIDIDDSVF